MKHLRRLQKTRGFTLVECIVAVAVFAVLVAMVLVIISNAMTLSHKSSQNEGTLNGLVQNVVDDTSNKRYGSDSGYLHMVIGDGSYNPSSSDTQFFAMSYSTVDGYKGFVKCPACHEINAMIDCMELVYSTSDYVTAKTNGDTLKYKLSYWYKQNIQLTCPKCSNTFFPTLKCKACANKAASNQTGSFTYDPGSGSFYCKSCGGSNVSALDPDSATDKYLTESEAGTFSVSGISSNAVRYGNVTFPNASDPANFTGRIVLELCTPPTTDPPTVYSLGAGSTFTVSISHQEDSDPNKPGVYTMVISGLSSVLDLNSAGNFNFRFPPNYVAKVQSKPADSTGVGVAFTPEATSNDYASFSVNNVMPSKVGDSVTIKFTLLNSKNNSDFAFDYPDSTLWQSWFGLSGSGSGSIAVSVT